MGAFQRILVATDFSSFSEPAFEEAVRIAAESGARLFVAHVHQIPINVTSAYLPAGVYEDYERAVRNEAQKQVGVLVEQAERRGLKASALVLQGFADQEILAAAKKEKIDLLVLGTHGRRGAARFFLGSVSARVVSAAPCPVLTVRSFQETG